MMAAARSVSARVLWANLHLLFWLSLLPFSTGWMGENHFAPVPVALLGLNLFLAGVAYTILLMAIVRHDGPGSKLAEVIGGDTKGKVSLALYVVSIGLALFVNHWLGFIGLFLPAAIWLIPDPRMEKAFAGRE